jgi:ABC-type nitrate/sulfonate/bicarbonate transport system substrate-binding protein
MATVATPTLQIGFVPLVDCALLAIAQEKFFFAAEGLNVELRKAQSWNAIHENLLSGQLDAAHLLITMPIQSLLSTPVRSGSSTSLGKSNDGTSSLCHAFTLSCNGNGIILSNTLWNSGVRNAETLKLWLCEKQDRSICLGVVFPQGTQEYLVRAWLATANLTIGPRVNLKIIAPQEMVGRLRKGEIDGFCAGDPWSRRATASKLGRLVSDSRKMFPGLGEKVLGVRTSWHHEHQMEHRKLVLALSRASRWLSESGNLVEAVEIVASKRYVNAPKSVVESAIRERTDWETSLLKGEASVALLASETEPANQRRLMLADSNFPSRTHIQWYLEQMLKYGHADARTCVRIDPTSICLEKFYQESLSKKAPSPAALFPMGFQATASSALRLS